MNYKGIAALIAAEAEIVAKEIMEANEGFDGEITESELALRVCASMAVNKWSRGHRAIAAISVTPVTPVAPVVAKAAKKGCKYCGETNVKWNQGERGWQLMNPDGNRHLCRREARQNQPQNQPVETSQPVAVATESFSETLRKV